MDTINDITNNVAINNEYILAKINEHFADATRSGQVVQNKNEAVATLITPKDSNTCSDEYFVIHRDNLLPVAKFLKEDDDLWFNFLKLITAVERGNVYSSVYHLYSYKHSFGITLRVDLPKDNPVADSLCGLWEGADWLERECYDMLGIRYRGHPELRRILLPLDWEGYPLRKDYVAPKMYGGINNA